MNTLTETEIINMGLSKARKGTIENIDTGNDDLTLKSRIFLKYVYQTLIGSYPWPFATKRAELDRIEGETPVRSYSQYYRLPLDAFLIWDIYYNPETYTRYGSIWNYRAYEFFSFEDSSDISFFSGVGELIGDKIASNNRRLFVLYSKKEKIPVQKWSVPFTNAVIASLSILFEENNTTDPELLRLKLASLDRERDKARHVSAIQNRKSYEPVRPQILELIDNYRIR